MGNNLVYNRIVITIVLIIVVPAMVFIIMMSLTGRSSKQLSEEARVKYVRDYTEKLNSRNADIMFFRQDPAGPDNLKARRVNALNDQGLALNLYSDRAYRVLILNDLSGSLTLNDQEIQTLKDLIENKGFRVIYLGSAKYQKLLAEGVIPANAKHKEGTKSYITFVNKSHARCSMDGFADNPVSMPITSGLTDEQVIIYTAVMELSLKDLFWS